MGINELETELKNMIACLERQVKELSVRVQIVEMGREALSSSIRFLDPIDGPFHQGIKVCSMEGSVVVRRAILLSRPSMVPVAVKPELFECKFDYGRTEVYFLCQNSYPADYQLYLVMETVLSVSLE